MSPGNISFSLCKGSGLRSESQGFIERIGTRCNSGNLEDLLSTLAPDVCHYFLPPSFPPITGAEHLARYWRKYKHALDPLWSIDRIIASGDEVVNEWSCL